MGGFTGASVGPWPAIVPDHLNPYEKDKWVRNHPDELAAAYPGVDIRTFLMVVPIFDAATNKMYYPGGSEAYWKIESARRRARQTAFDKRVQAETETQEQFRMAMEGYDMNGSQTIGATGTLQIGETFKKYLPLILIAGIVFFIILKK